MDEFVDVSETGWSRAFFIANYIMGVAVILNLVVTVVINSFWDEYKTTNKPALAFRQLQDAAAASARPPQPTQDGCGVDGGGLNGVSGGGNGGGGVSGGVGGGGGETGEGTALTDSTGSDTDMSVGVEGGAFDPRSSRQNGGSFRLGFSHEEEGVEDDVVGSGEEKNSARVVGEGGYIGSGGGGLNRGASDPRLHRLHQPPQVMPNGDQEGMEAERDIARRASRRRLNVSGLA